MKDISHFIFCSILTIKSFFKERRTRTSSLQSEQVPAEVRPIQKWFIGGSESQPAVARDRNVTRARCLAADILGNILWHTTNVYSYPVRKRKYLKLIR